MPFVKDFLTHIIDPPPQQKKSITTPTMTEQVEAPIVHGTISVSELFVGSVNGAAYGGGGGGGGGVSSADLAAYFDTTKPTIVGGDFDNGATPETRIMYVGETFDPYNYRRRVQEDSGEISMHGKSLIVALDQSTDSTTPVELADDDTTFKVYTNGTAGDAGANPELQLGDMFTHLNYAGDLGWSGELTIPDGELWLVSEDNAALRAVMTQAAPGLLDQYPWLKADTETFPGTAYSLGGLGVFAERFDTPCTMFFRFTPSETTSQYGAMFSSLLTGSTVEWLWTDASIEFGHSEDALYFSVLEQPLSNFNITTDMYKNRLLVKKHTGKLLKGYTYEAFVSWPDVTDRSLWPASRGGTVQMASQPSGDRITIGWRVAALPDGTETSQSEWNVGPGVFGVDSLTGSGDGSSAHVHATGSPCVQSTDPLSTYVIQNALSAQFKYDGTPTTANKFQGYQWPTATQHRVFHLNGQVDLARTVAPYQNKGPLLIRLYNTDITDPAVFSAPKLTPTSSLKLGTHYIRHIATDKYGNQTDNQTEFYRQVEVLTDSATTPVFSTAADVVFDTTTAANTSQGGYDVMVGASGDSNLWIVSSTQDWSFSVQLNIPETGTETDTRVDPVGRYADRTALVIGTLTGDSSMNDDGLYTGTSYIMFQTRHEDHWLNDTGTAEPRDVVRMVINHYSSNNDSNYTFMMDLQSEVQEHKFMEIMLSYRVGHTAGTTGPGGLATLFDTSAPKKGIGDGLSVFMRSAIDSASSLPTAWRKIEISDAARPTYYNRIVTPVGAVSHAFLKELEKVNTPQVRAGMIGMVEGGPPSGTTAETLESSFDMALVQNSADLSYRLTLNSNTDYDLHDGVAFSVSPGTYTITLAQTTGDVYYVGILTYPDWSVPPGISLTVDDGSNDAVTTFRPGSAGAEFMVVYKGTITMTVNDAFNGNTARFYVHSTDTSKTAVNSRANGTNDLYSSAPEPLGITSANGDVRNLNFYQTFMTPNMLNSSNYLKNVDSGVQQNDISTAVPMHGQSPTPLP